MSKFNTLYRAVGKSKDAVTCCVRVLVPDKFVHRLETLYDLSLTSVKKMLKDRSKTSSKFYPEIPCVLSKSLIAKYQANPKCYSVTNLVLPICGDKGKQVKSVEEGVRIPAIFKKEILPVKILREIEGHIRGVEFYKRNEKWFCSLSYRPLLPNTIIPTGTIGVDRNSVGNVAVLADIQTGHVRHLGFNPAATKYCWRRRKKNLQRQGKRRLLSKLRKNHARRNKLQNHIVSKAVVNYAVSHSRAIALEKLEDVTAKGSKIKSYSTKNQWSFAQLASFIQYKARLAGVTVVEVDPAYTSQTCSRCDNVHKPDRKKFACQSCGHKDHRDSNSAFVIAKRGLGFVGLAKDSVSLRSGPIDGPVSGKLEATNLLCV